MACAVVVDNEKGNPVLIYQRLTFFFSAVTHMENNPQKEMR